MKAKMAILVMVVVIIAGFASQAVAMNPPPEGSHYMGPAIRGQVTFTPGNLISGLEVRGVLFDFLGDCAGQTVSVEDNDYYINGDVYYEDVTEEALDGYFEAYYDWIPPGCWPNLKDGDSPDGIMFLQVLSYKEYTSPDRKTADVILLWVVPK